MVGPETISTLDYHEFFRYHHFCVPVNNTYNIALKALIYVLDSFLYFTAIKSMLCKNVHLAVSRHMSFKRAIGSECAITD